MSDKFGLLRLQGMTNDSPDDLEDSASPPVHCAHCGALNDTDFGFGPPDAVEGDLLQCGRCGALTPYPGARVPTEPWETPLDGVEYHGWVQDRVDYPDWYPDTADDEEDEEEDLLGRGYPQEFPAPKPSGLEPEDYEPHFPLCLRCNRKAHKPSAPCPAKREKMARNLKSEARDEMRRWGGST